jgi:hypothetical protein
MLVCFCFLKSFSNVVSLRLAGLVSLIQKFLLLRISRLVLGLCVFQVAVAQFFMNIGSAQNVCFGFCFYQHLIALFTDT